MIYRARRLSDKSLRNLTVVTNPGAERVGIWEQQRRAYLASHNARSMETEDWNWGEKRVSAADDSESVLIGAECGGHCQGMIVIFWPRQARLVAMEETAYVEYLETAPWNRIAVAGEREFKGVATSLMHIAYDLSVVLGYEGRLSLASLSSAEEFYERIGMIRSGVGDGVDHDLAYFEFEKAAAARFRNG